MNNQNEKYEEIKERDNEFRKILETYYSPEARRIIDMLSFMGNEMNSLYENESIQRILSQGDVDSVELKQFLEHLNTTINHFLRVI